MKYGILFMALANILAWFQFNSQFVWPWFKDKPILTNLIFAVPMGVCFWYGIKLIVEASGQLWTSKLVGFGVGNIIFAAMTWAMLNETPFTSKTMACLFLAFLIILIQLFWK